MGPKRRVSVVERQQRSSTATASTLPTATAIAAATVAAAATKSTTTFTATTAKKRSISSVTSKRKNVLSSCCSSGGGIISANGSNNISTSTSPKKSNVKQQTAITTTITVAATAAPLKKSLKCVAKERERVQQTDQKLLPENRLEKCKIEEKKATRASSRENAKRSTPNLILEKNIIVKTKEDSSPSIEVQSTNSCASTASSNNSSVGSSNLGKICTGSVKISDRKDEKTKAISKMLKSLDIKISGFDNILPKNEIITDLGLKSSISENVKTKSRAAAVKVIANMNPPKQLKRSKSDDDKKKLTQKQQQQQQQQQNKNSIQQKDEVEIVMAHITEESSLINLNDKIVMSTMTPTLTPTTTTTAITTTAIAPSSTVVGATSNTKINEILNEKLTEEKAQIMFLPVSENKKKIAAKKAKIDKSNQKVSKHMQNEKCKMKKDFQKQKRCEVEKNDEPNDGKQEKKVQDIDQSEQVEEEKKGKVEGEKDNESEKEKENLKESAASVEVTTTTTTNSTTITKATSNNLDEVKRNVRKFDDVSIDTDSRKVNIAKHEADELNKIKKEIKKDEEIKQTIELTLDKETNHFELNDDKNKSPRALSKIIKSLTKRPPINMNKENDKQTQLKYEEKDEILKVVLDTNTAIVQMEIEAIPANKAIKIEKEQQLLLIEQSETKLKTSSPTLYDDNNDKLLQQKQNESNGQVIKLHPPKKLSSFDKELKGKEKRLPDIKQRLQGKFKVKVQPAKQKISMKQSKKATTTLSKLLTQTTTINIDLNKDESKDDIYDFKSGSEEEEFIKMDLPTLKNLREFSDDEDNKPLKVSPKRTATKFSNYREKLQKSQETQQKVNIFKEESSKKPQETDNKQNSNASIKNTEKATSSKATVKKVKGLAKGQKSGTAKTLKKKILNQKGKKPKIFKGKILKNVEKIKGKSINPKENNNDNDNDDDDNDNENDNASEAASSTDTESNDSEDEQKLILFGQKRQRMASLNALAKVQCLYENESRTAYELGLSKATLLPPKIRTVDGSEDERDKEKDKAKESRDAEKLKIKEKLERVKDKNTEKLFKDSTIKEKSKGKKENKANVDPLKIEDVTAKEDSQEEEPVEEPKRELRNVSGGRGLGKHWEFDSDSEAEEAERLKLKRKKLQKKLQIKKEKELEKEKAKAMGRIKEAENKSKGNETVPSETNKINEVIKIKRKYTKIKGPLKKVVKLVAASSEEEDEDGRNSENSDKEKDHGHKHDGDLVLKTKLETKKPPKKRKRIFKEDLIGDYKGILARKRMASLNATAIVAATYEVERHLDKNLDSDCSSYDSYENHKKTYNDKVKDSIKSIVKDPNTVDNVNIINDCSSKQLSVVVGNILPATVSVTKTPTKLDKLQNICDESNDSKYSKETKETNTDTTTTTSTNIGNTTSGGGTSKESSRPTSSSVVIVQDTDVTITGVYVNSSAGSGQEAYCKMQYRVQSSVTEERLLRPGSVDPPPKSYTPLSALSSMLPPGASAGVTNPSNEGHNTATPPPPLAHAPIPPPSQSSSVNIPPSSVNVPPCDIINPVAALYHSADLGIHTEHPPNEHTHGPPPPSYAAAAAAAAAAYHAHHMAPHAAATHHQSQYGHGHTHHQYPQTHSGSEYNIGMPPPPHHYATSARPTAHYAPLPLPGSPPPTYRASNAYLTPVSGPHQPPSVGGSGAFCPTNAHPMQQQQLSLSATTAPATLSGASSSTQSTTHITTLQHQQQQHHQQQQQHQHHQQQQQQQQQQLGGGGGGAGQAAFNESSGYYQPAGPLISTPHVLPPVSSGLPLPPPPNVPLLPTGGGIKGKCSLATPPISVSTISTDSEHLQQLQQARGGVGGVGTQNANSAVETSSMENDVLVAGGDLTPFRYPTQNLLNSGATVQHQQQQQQHQQQQQQQQQHQQQQQQLHQQAAAAAAVAAAAAAVAAHPSSSYPRSIHAQMHYSPPYPANYYSPYPGEPMCYSPPAYQPYFSSKVYQSAPPPPHPPPPAAYRHYPYYQTGHPPPPTDLYEQVPGPPTGSSGQQGGPVPIQGAPPPSQPPGTQLVPAGQHVEHYPGPPTYYAGYNTTGAAAAAQCYTRSLQGPYMEYPPAQCPCPMQQSCPKNVHTGPHIGSNTSGNNNNSSSNNNNNINNNTALTNGNNMTINHNNNGAIVAIQHNSHNNIECNNNNNINKNNNNINCTKNNNSNNNNNNSHTNIINNSHTNKMQACNNGVMNVSNGSNAMPMLNTNRGPVKICNTETTTATTTITTNLYEDNDKIVSDMVNKNHNNLDILSPTAVKTELKLEEFDNKSQYEETFIPPLTPLTIDKDDKYEGIKVAAKEAIIPAVLPIFEDVEEALDKLQDAKSPTHSIMPTAHLYNGNTIEEYDLTTATPPLITNSNKNTNTNKGSYNLNNQINTVNNSTQQVGPPTVIRRARIGKTMAREMVYAAANTITPSFTNNVSTRSINGPVLPKPISNNELTHITPKPTPKVIVNTTPAHNQAPSIAVTPIANTLSKLEAIVPVAIPLVLKAEIKSEKIKLEEDEVLDKVLRQQIMTATTTTTTKQSSSHSSAIQTSSLAPQSSITSFASQIHINQEKIKAEPINVNEILLHDSKVKLENDHEFELEIVPDVKKVVQKPKEIVAVKEVTVNKVKNRMRLLPSWQQPTLSCDIDLCHTSEDDEILDLCHSPICNGNGNGKRIKTLDYSKAQCKKSPPNSYKSLIKQTQPKTYLCLSRKINKKSRYGKLQTTKSSKANANNGTTVRRRELILTDQQKQRLRLRKKKLAAMEKQKMEAKELRKREHKQKHKELKQNTHKSPSLSSSCLSGASLKLKSAKEIKIENDSVIVDLIGEEEEEPIKLVTDVESVKDKCIENDICQQGLLRNDLDTINLSNVTFRASPKHVKSVKKPAIPQHIKETIDAVARGYFSEPETHSAVICVASSPPHATQSPINVSDAKDQDAVVTCSKVNSKHLKTNAEKRSKSESKKPIKMYSTGSMAVGNATCIDLKKRNLESKSVTPADGIVMKFSKTTTINNDVLTTTATTTTTLSPVVVAAATTTTTTTATASTTISTSTHLQDAQLIENQNIHNNNNINNNNNNNNNKNIINNNYSMKFDESLMMKTDRKNLKKDKEKSKYKKSKVSQKDRNKISHMNVVNVQGKEAAATIINITRTETGAGPVITTTTAPTTIPTTDISRDNNHNKNDNEIEALSTITISDHHSSASSSSSSVSPTPSSTLSPSPSSSSLSLIKEQHTNELNNNKVLTSSNQPQQQKQQQHQHDIQALPIEIDCNDIGASDKTYIDLTQNATEELYLQTVQQQQEQQQQQHSDDLMTDSMFLAPPPLPRIVCNSQYHQQHSVKRNRSRSKFGSRKRQKLKHSTVSFELDETLPPATRVDVIPKWNNGWTWEGKPFQGAVFLNSDDPLVLRTCYPAMRHVEGDIIRTRDCVLLKANEDNELPYVAKVAHLWENPEDGEMMMSLLWYYRPEHTEQGRQPNDSSDEVYASRHRDHNSVACIEDKCYVLTFSEYCRYRRRIRASEEDIEDVNIVPKRLNYLNIRNVPDNTNPELIMFCRRAYEFRTKRLLKMPNKQDYYVVKA